MKKALWLALWVGIVLVSCKKDTGGGDGVDSVEMSISASEVRPLQILPVAVSGVSLVNAAYNGTIGGMDVEFYPANENAYSSLVCVVPENVGTGIQTITVDIEGQTLSSDVNVLPNETISTPEDVFDQFYADYTTTEYAEFIDEAEFQSALDDLRALPETDRLIAAQMLANNRVALDNIAQSIANAEAETGLSYGKVDASCGILCVIGGATAVIGTFLSAPIATAVGIGVLAGLVAKALKPVVTALWNKLVTGVTAALRLGYDRMAYITELVYDQADQMISNKVEAIPDTIYLENGSPLKLAVKTVREPIISENNRDEYTEVGGFLDMYYDLVDFLAGTEYQVPSLQNGEVADYALDLDDFSISVDNPLVTVSEISGTPELAEVTFDSPQQGAHVFDFTYSYVNEEGLESSFTQTARLLNIEQYVNWSGTSSFSDTDSRSMDVRTDLFENVNMENDRWVNFELGNFWHVNDHETYSGVVRVDRVYFRITDYTGPGTYTNVTGTFPDVGVMDVNIKVNVPFEMSTGNWLWDNTDFCTYAESSYGQGYSATVTVIEDEWIADYLVITGTFNITVTNPSIHNSGSCTSPANFTGNFQVAAEGY